MGIYPWTIFNIMPIYGLYSTALQPTLVFNLFILFTLQITKSLHRMVIVMHQL
jgi:hypothetical protein